MRVILRRDIIDKASSVAYRGRSQYSRREVGLAALFVETLGSETGSGYSFSEPNRFCSGSELKNMRRESLNAPCGYSSGGELDDWVELY